MARRTRARLARVLRCQGEIVETPLGRPESTAGAQRVLYQHGHPRLYSVTDCPAKEGVVGTQKVRPAAWQEQVIAKVNYADQACQLAHQSMDRRPDQSGLCPPHAAVVGLVDSYTEEDIKARSPGVLARMQTCLTRWARRGDAGA